MVGTVVGRLSGMAASVGIRGGRGVSVGRAMICVTVGTAVRVTVSDVGVSAQAHTNSRKAISQRFLILYLAISELPTGPPVNKL
jgi:hypothetical protein